MFDDDIDYNAVFEVETEPETGSGAEDQEAAAPEADAETGGAEEQEAAEPADETGDDEAPDDTEPSERKPRGQKDSVYAAARRRAEAEADAKAEAKKNKEIDEIIKSFGWTDPYTQKTIESKADYVAYLTKYNEDRRKKIAEKSGMTDEEFTEYIGELPEVKEAREAKEQAQQAQIQAQIAEELRQISALDPSVHSVNDVLSGEGSDQIKAMLGRGLTLLEAFKLVNYDRLRSVSAEDERRRAEANAAGKSHLQATKSRATGMVSVPRETLHYYKLFFPNMSESDIQKDYNKQLNTGGK